MTMPTATTGVHEDADALVVYASDHGHTAKIAARIAAALREHGVTADVQAVTDARRTQAGRYELVVVAASLHRERHQQSIVDWVAGRHDALATVPTAFVSVSLSAAEDTDEARAATQRCADAFCAQANWAPTRVARIAGALQYREYDVFTRTLMRLLMRRMHHPTDASRDYDYTDWDDVDRFAVELAALVPARATTTSP